MHRHQRTLHTVALAAFSLLAAPSAGAQHFQQTTTIGSPTSIMVNIGGSVTWHAREVKWPSGAPAAAPLRATTPNTPAVQSRTAVKPSSTSVELISPTSNADASLAQWAHAVGSATPMEVTLTLLNASGAPVMKYLLHRALPTKLAIGQLDAGANQVQLTHLTLTAQSIEVVPAGQ